MIEDFVDEVGSVVARLLARAAAEDARAKCGFWRRCRASYVVLVVGKGGYAGVLLR